MSTSLLAQHKVAIIDIAYITNDVVCPVKACIRVAAQRLHKSLRDHGFAMLVNHGITDHKLRRAYCKLDVFCSSPESERNKYVSTGDDQTRNGYIMPGKKTIGKLHEYKHVLNIHSLDEGLLSEIEVPGFKELIQNLTDDFASLAKVILQLIAIGCNVSPHYFLAKHSLNGDEDRSIFQMVHYPPMDDCKPSNESNSGQLCDSGTFTLIAQDSESGLEVMEGHNKWVQVGHLPGALILRAGEKLQQWTGGVYKQLNFRMTLPKDPNSLSRSRHCALLYVDTPKTVSIEPINIVSYEMKPFQADQKKCGRVMRAYLYLACGDAKSKPGFLSDKSLESSIKYIVRRFPNIDVKSLQPISQIRSEIIKSLSLYYYTFVDLLDFKDNVCDLLTTMDACQLSLDITLNFELTKSYLDLCVTYVSLMILLSKVEDRKAVLGLFNAAYEMMHSQSDQSFPRLGQMIMEYDAPLKKLSEEFVPHTKLLYTSLMSLRPVFFNRNLSADKWRSEQKLSLVGNPGQLLKPLQTENMSCEYLSLETMEKWIIFGFLLCHQQGLAQADQGHKMWINALESSWVIPLFRDEVIYIHSYIQNLFDSIKGYGKRISEVKDCFNHAIQKATYKHRERRKFLRTALKELALILTDQPGLLGPKALLIFIGLSFAKDEVYWLLRHNDNPPQQKSKGKNSEDLVDRQLPELLFHMEELRILVRKYSQVIQRYYIQYLSGFDAIALNQMMQNLAVCPEDESIILSSLCNTIANLSVKQVEDNEIFDFQGLRIDWFRLQACTSVMKSPLPLTEKRELANLLDTVIFHTKMVDYLDEILVETSDLSIFCFYNKIFEDQFHMCLEFPAQNRYIIAFPLICNHFQCCTHDLCPEERHHIRERSLSVVNMFLEEMAKEAKNIITTICDEQCTMSDKLLPKHCALPIAQIVNRKKKDKNKKSVPEMMKPGTESYRKTREELTTMDKLHMALTELCFALNYCATINVWEYTFAPREYLHQHLENRFSRALVGMVMFNSNTNEIAKPSELLASVRAYMNVLQTVENYVHIDITRVFNNALLQQTQQVDSHGEKTVAALYTQWYSDVLLRRVSAGSICFSMNQKAFVSLSAEGAIPFNAEEFSDINELRALAELIGPYGMKLLNETLMWHIASQVQELKRLVASNKDVLLALRTHFDKPEVMKEQFKKLTSVDNVLQRMTIIGVILCFRQLAQEAVVDVLEERIPFLLTSILDFCQHLPGGDTSVVCEMASAAGLSCKVDPTLAAQLKIQKCEIDEEEHLLACLLMVFIAVSIPKLARNENSFYKASLEGHANNIHCMASAINNIFGALFTICGQGDIEDRMKEFLALASSSLLRLGQEADKEMTKHRESVYLLLDLIVQESPFLTMDLLESCFPYALIRNAYHAVYKQENLQP